MPFRRRCILLTRSSASPTHRLHFSSTTSIHAPIPTLPQSRRGLERPQIQRLPLHQLRTFTQTRSQGFKSEAETKARHRGGGPFSWKAAALFLLTGAAMIVYFREEKRRMDRQRIAEQTKGMGKPKVGGPFDLVDQQGRRFTSEDMKGRYALVYFGFTHCPDICPEELDKMAEMYDQVVEACGRDTIRPIFISCDPARDTPDVVRTYLKEFHDEFIGLTGTYDNIKQTCKEYRVYFSTPPHLKPGQDYLVDHSIYFYLMDPEGDFVEAIGRTHSAEDAAQIITGHVRDWKLKGNAFR